MTDIKARLREMYAQPEPDFRAILNGKAKAKAKTAVEPEVEPDAEVTAVDDTEAEPAAEQQPEREYFVRNHQNERMTTDQFNIEEGKRWVADHFGPAKQPALEDVPDGHYASDDVSHEEYAAAYERYTGSPYRQRCYTIKSNRPL